MSTFWESLLFGLGSAALFATGIGAVEGMIGIGMEALGEGAAAAGGEAVAGEAAGEAGASSWAGKAGEFLKRPTVRRNLKRIGVNAIGAGVGVGLSAPQWGRDAKNQALQDYNDDYQKAMNKYNDFEYNYQQQLQEQQMLSNNTEANNSALNQYSNASLATFSGHHDQLYHTDTLDQWLKDHPDAKVPKFDPDHPNDIHGYDPNNSRFNNRMGVSRNNRFRL